MSTNKQNKNKMVLKNFFEIKPDSCAINCCTVYSWKYGWFFILFISFNSLLYLNFKDCQCYKKNVIQRLFEFISGIVWCENKGEDPPKLIAVASDSTDDSSDSSDDDPSKYLYSFLNK